MLPAFYPDPVFGWAFYAVLIGFLAVATYCDLGSLRIPKTVTLTMLAAGVVFSIVRGAWMGSLPLGTEGRVVFAFADSPALGALDGLLCSLAGFAVGFALFWLMWVLGVVGGGDVKLVAALGAWVGPLGILILIFGSVVVFFIIGVVRLVQKALRRGVQKTVFGVKERAAKDNIKKTPTGAQRRDKLIAYSLPVAIATALLLPVSIWTDQYKQRQVQAPPAQQASTQP
jgi:prepilin peptidase CpaA